MSRSNIKQSERSELSDSFEDNLATLFDELSFAVQWQRPSILLVTYDSELVLDRGESFLEDRVRIIQQKVVRFQVDEKNFDVPLLLSKRSDRDSSIYFVTGLSTAGGREGANAYRALNIRREYFVDYTIRAVFWLTRTEAIGLSFHAPDFWAFRHREVDLSGAFETEARGIPTAKLNKAAPAIPARLVDLFEQISILENKLTGLAKGRKTNPARLNYLGSLALSYRMNGAYLRAETRSKQAIAIAKELKDDKWLGKLWGNLGDIYLEHQQPNRAVRAYRKAIRYSSQEADLWNRLGHFYHIMQRLQDAIIAYKHAIRLDSNDISAYSSLVACYRLTGKNTKAKKLMEVARPILQNVSEYCQAAFESVCGNTDQALDLLEQALKKMQVQPGALRRDPNFDFIRDDPRFEKVIRSIESR